MTNMERIILNKEEIRNCYEVSKKDVEQWDKLLTGILNHYKLVHTEFDAIYRVRTLFENYCIDKVDRAFMWTHEG